MKKNNIISLILSLIVVFNMVFCVSAMGLQNGDTDSAYGTSASSSESTGVLSEDTDAINKGVDENPLDSAVSDGDTVGALSATDSMQAFLEEDLPKVTPDNASSSSGKIDIKKYLPVILGILAAVVIAIVVIILKNNKKKSDSDNKTQKHHTDINIETYEGNAEEIRYGYEFKGNVSVNKNVPTSTPSAIDGTVASEDTSEPTTEIDNTHEIIMSIYKGEASADSFTGEVTPLTLANSYDLQIRQNACPKFAVSSSASTDYILVNGKYLYLNYRIFNKSEFVLYSDIAAVEKCFDIFNRMDAVVVPERQQIFDFKPAVIEIDGEDFAVSEKGKITVE